jgi:hypothetical protein
MRHPFLAEDPTSQAQAQARPSSTASYAAAGAGQQASHAPQRPPAAQPPKHTHSQSRSSQTYQAEDASHRAFRLGEQSATAAASGSNRMANLPREISSKQSLATNVSSGAEERRASAAQLRSLASSERIGAGSTSRDTQASGGQAAGMRRASPPVAPISQLQKTLMLIRL